MDAGGVEVLGITYEYNQIWDFDLKEGRYFTENEMYGGKSYCIIGANIEEGLFTTGENPWANRYPYEDKNLLSLVFLKR